jgi:hypothetical protein
MRVSDSVGVCLWVFAVTTTLQPTKLAPRFRFPSASPVNADPASPSTALENSENACFNVSQNHSWQFHSAFAGTCPCIPSGRGEHVCRRDQGLVSPHESCSPTEMKTKERKESTIVKVGVCCTHKCST